MAAALPDLVGHTIPLVGYQGWDHTYATSSDGFVWPCWGRSAGGAAIVSAPGRSKVADCLSRNNSQAGLVYAVTGVCHQTANRILDPANIVVAGAGGYAVSRWLFGTYGIGPWPQRASCYAAQSTTGPKGGSGGSMPSGGPRKRAGLSRYVAAAQRAAATGDRDAEQAEIAALIELSLGEDADERTVERLHAVQTTLRSEQGELRRLLEDHAISPETYLERLERVLAGAMRENEAILGTERFLAVFGEAGRHPTGLVDREVFLGQPGP